MGPADRHATAVDGRAVPLQVHKLLMQYKRANALTDAAVDNLLCILEMVLPNSHSLAASFYLLRKWAGKQVKKQFNSNTAVVRELCPNTHCDHIWEDDSETCPKCGDARHRCAATAPCSEQTGAEGSTLPVCGAGPDASLDSTETLASRTECACCCIELSGALHGIRSMWLLN